MKIISILFTTLCFTGNAYGDIAPNPIAIKGIYTVDSCQIQMKSEFVYADLYNDSARVECIFELINFGDSVTIQIGFPEMNFHYWSIGGYAFNDKANFEILVDGRLLTQDEIGVPPELDSIYRAFMRLYDSDREYNRKADSIYASHQAIVDKRGDYHYPSAESHAAARSALDDLSLSRVSMYDIDFALQHELDNQKKKGNFPWYVWNVRFDRNEKKEIKVVYKLPSGIGYGTDFRYFNYILETGSGWLGSIEQAEIELRLHDIMLETLEEISPAGYEIDPISKTLKWHLTNLEPTANDNIYVRYFNAAERRDWERYQKKMKRAGKFRWLNPLNWFR